MKPSKCANSESIIHLLKAAQQVADSNCCSFGVNKRLEEGMNKILSCITVLSNKIDTIEAKLDDIIKQRHNYYDTESMDDGEDDAFQKIRLPDELDRFEEQLATDLEFKAKTVSLLIYPVKSTPIIKTSICLISVSSDQT